MMSSRECVDIAWARMFLVKGNRNDKHVLLKELQVID